MVFVDVGPPPSLLVAPAPPVASSLLGTPCGGFPPGARRFAGRQEIGRELGGRRLAGGVVLPHEIEQREAVPALRQSARRAMTRRAGGGEKAVGGFSGMGLL